MFIVDNNRVTETLDDLRRRGFEVVVTDGQDRSELVVVRADAEGTGLAVAPPAPQAPKPRRSILSRILSREPKEEGD